MRSLRVKGAIAVAIVGAVAIAAAAMAGDRAKIGTVMTGYKEVPAVSTTGNGTFHARISRSAHRAVNALYNAPTPLAHAVDCGPYRNDGEFELSFFYFTRSHTSSW